MGSMPAAVQPVAHLIMPAGESKSRAEEEAIISRVRTLAARVSCSLQGRHRCAMLACAAMPSEKAEPLLSGRCREPVAFYSSSSAAGPMVSYPQYVHGCRSWRCSSRG